MAHPAQIVTDAVAALSRRDWSAFTALCDPVSLRRFKRDLEWQFKESKPGDDKTIEDFVEDMPDVPREVAEYHFAELQRARLGPEQRLKLEAYTIASVSELKSLDPDQVLIKWLEARMPSESEAYALRQIDQESRLAFTVLGSVRDGPVFSHVLCRNNSTGLSLCDEEDSDTYMIPKDERDLESELSLRSHLDLQTVTCRRQEDGTWRLIADRNMFFLAIMTHGPLSEELD